MSVNLSVENSGWLWKFRGYKLIQESGRCLSVVFNTNEIVYSSIPG